MCDDLLDCVLSIFALVVVAAGWMLLACMTWCE